MYTILSLDGGGIRGALTARLIQRIEAAAPFVHRVDLVAGTSIGGINALYLADGRSPTELVELFRVHGATIFKQRSWWDRFFEFIDMIFRAKFTQKGLQHVLTGVFGKRTIGELKKRVLVSSFDLDNEAKKTESKMWKPKLFHNFPGPTSDGDQKIVDVALRTSAAPTYFPSYQGYIDGGVAANNPAMCALAKAVGSGVPLTEIVLLSIGTGVNPHYIEGQTLDWGLKNWAAKLLPMMFDAMVGIPDYQCAQLLGPRYVRINPYLVENIDLSDATKVDVLLKTADQTNIESAIKLLAG